MARFSALQGLPASNKRWLAISLLYSTTVGLFGFSMYRRRKAHEKQDFVDFYRDCGVYQHPWVKNPAEVPETVRKTDYAKMIKTPQRNLNLRSV